MLVHGPVVAPSTSAQLGASQVTDVAAAMQISASDSSEVGFNMACALLQLGAFTEAEEQLQLALRAGVHRCSRMWCGTPVARSSHTSAIWECRHLLPQGSCRVATGVLRDFGNRAHATAFH